MSKECPEERVVIDKPKIHCDNCDQDGHYRRDCREERADKRELRCRRCDEVGHMAKDCEQPNDVQCRNCDQSESAVQS